MEKVLRDCEDTLVSLLCEENGKKLCDKFYEENLLSKESYDNFNSLDHSRLKPELQVKYLVRLVSKEVMANPSVGENLIELLGTMKGVPSSLINKLHQAKVAANTDLTDDSDKVGGESATTMGEHTMEQDIFLTPDDVSLLTEWLAEASHKWVQIAISLGLKEHERAKCEGKDNMISLSQCIEYWINNSNATFKKLTDTLSSKTVGCKTLAKEIKEKCKELRGSCKKWKKRHSPKKSNQAPRITKNSLPCEVIDGKSTLLQVHAEPKHSVSYQWNKAGQPLTKNSSRYSGVDEDILVVRHACQGTEGDYTCCVSLQDKPVTSNPINLKVQFSPAKKRLLNSYSTLKEVPISKTDWPPEVANKFIKLAIIKSTSTNMSETVQGTADIIIAEKEKIEYDEVFGEYKSKELILVKGRPGSGKTTLVHKVTKDWASGKALANATLTILLTLRLLNFDSKNETLPTALQSLYSNDKLTELAEAKDGEGVCFLLDGLDEYRPQNKQKSVVMELLDRKYLPMSMIIVFSRPSAFDQLQKDFITKRIEVFGFEKKHIPEYIDNFPFDEDYTSHSSITRASQLKEYLVDNPNIHDMCYLPIHAAMICFLFKFAKNISSTPTKVYDEFTRLIIQRHLARHEECKELASLKDLKGVHAKNFKKLCRLAHEMTINSKQVISSQEVQAKLGGSGSLSEEEGLGLLTICPTLYQTGIYQNYAFLHMTFQEFLTAYYISNYLDELLQGKLVLKYSHMKRVWRFYISLIDFTEALKKIDLFFINKDWDDLYLCQCAFDLKQKIFCDEVLKRNSCRLKCDNIKTPADILAIDYVIATSCLSLTKLEVCNYDHDDERITSLFSHLQEKDQELNNLSFGILFDNGTASLCQLIKSATNITVLQLFINHTCSCNATKLANQISHCTKLNLLILIYCGTPECIQSFVSSLNPAVRGWCYVLFVKLDCQSIQALGIGLQHCNYSSRLMLSVTHSDINDISITCLADSLRNFKSLGLDLRNNNIDSTGIITLAKRLDTLHLNSLILSHNNIGPEGAAALAREIKCLTELYWLDLSHNNIGPNSVVALAEGAKYLTKLDQCVISNNNIDVAAAKAVISTLKECSTLVINSTSESDSLNKSRNQIVVEGLVSPDDTATISDLVEAAQHETKIKKLNLGFRTIQVPPKNYTYQIM